MNALQPANDGGCFGVLRWTRSFVLTGVVIVVLIVGSAALAISHIRQLATQGYHDGMTNLAAVLAEQTLRYVQVIDLTTIEVQSKIRDLNDGKYPEVEDRIRTDEIHNLLVERMLHVPQAGAMVLVGKDGAVLNSSRPGQPRGLNVSDHDFYQYLKLHDDQSLFIGSPGKSRITGNWSLYLARRINGPDGAFVGLIVSVVDTAYLDNFYRSISHNLGGTISLLRRDSTILVRYPDPRKFVGQHIASESPWFAMVAAGGGYYRTPGYITGMPSMVAVYPLQDYPLVVNVQQPQAVILAAWRQDAIYIALWAVVVAFGFATLAWVITGLFRRQQDQNISLEQTAATLRETELTLAAFAEMSSDWSWDQDADFRFRRPSNIPLTARPTDVGKARWDLADPAMNSHRWDLHKADLAARRPFRDFRWERIRIDGKRRYMSTSGNPIFDQHGTFLGYHGTGRDITPDVEAAEELRVAKEQSEAANRANADLVTAVHFANDAIIGLAPDGLIRTWNPAAERLYDLPAESIIGKNIAILWPREQKATVIAVLRALEHGEIISGLDTVRTDPGGRTVHISISGAPVIRSDGAITGLIATARDISDRVHTERALRRSQEHIASVFRNASVGLNQSDTRGQYIQVNARFCEIVGRTAEDLMGLSFEEISHPDDAIDSAALDALRERGTPIVLEKRYIRPDGSHVWVRNSLSPARDEDGNFAGIVTVVEDIAERKEAEDRLRHMAYHDALTGLANRRHLNEQLTQALARTAQPCSSFAVLALDLDRFKAINDTLGHDAGDLLLAEVANRLKAAVRATDTVARIGGDEIVIVQSDVTQPEAARELARRLIDRIAEPFDIGGRTVKVGVSVGIATYPADGTTSIVLLQHADVALYRAKKDGRGTFRVFEATDGADLSRRHILEDDLRRAIGTGQLDLHFQPIFTCAARVLVGFEALLRWQHPLLGKIPPTDIILVAEESGLMMRLGLWILEKACGEAVLWSQPLRVSVNLSTSQFRDEALAERVVDILHRTGLPAERLELEVTETVCIDNTARALATLRALKDAGVSIALDDFGTGYSSLSYLRSFPFDRIKIDRSFVLALAVDTTALSLVQAILALGHNLGLLVTAEGVETEQQLDLLRRDHCEEVQGFLLGRPMPSEDVAEYLHATPQEPMPLLISI
jgi:diguanylate cyclase (GGDEF)-like protein/PAS domain S-box-containing protein